MKDIDRLIAHKEAAIAWLQDEIKALKRALSTPATASILQSGVKRGEFKKGSRRGTYFLVK